MHCIYIRSIKKCSDEKKRPFCHLLDGLGCVLERFRPTSLEKSEK